MTPIYLMYLLAGLVTLFWPIATMLTRRVVMKAQWLMSGALFLFGLCHVVYGTLFNNFLKGEYLLVILFMVLIMVSQPMVHIAVVSLTSTRGVTRGARILFVPTIFVVLMLFVSFMIGGSDMYHLWIERGANGHASDFYANSDKYNLIVFSHFYLFWFVLMAEIVFLVVYSFFKIRKYRRQLNDYFPSDRGHYEKLRLVYYEVTLISLVTLANLIFYPFNVDRPIWVVAVTCSIYALTAISVGYYMYSLSFGAEKLAERLDSGRRRSRGNMHDMANRLVEYVEKERHFLDASLSVFSLAQRFNISEDEVVDALHSRFGTNFGDYIDGLRVEHACRLMLEQQGLDPDDADSMATIARECGYSNGHYFEHAFAKTMRASVKEWLGRVDDDRAKPRP